MQYVHKLNHVTHQILLNLMKRLIHLLLAAVVCASAATTNANELAQPTQDLKAFFSVLTYKVRANEGLSFDDVVISMRQRANKINLKMVGINPLWREVTATTGKPTPRVEIYSFCDALVARELMDYSFESIIFMPCRVGVAEDADGKIWLMTLNWNLVWIEKMTQNDPMSPSLEKNIRRLINSLTDVIQAGATGHL